MRPDTRHLWLSSGERLIYFDFLPMFKIHKMDTMYSLHRVSQSLLEGYLYPLDLSTDSQPYFTRIFPF